MVTGSAVKQMTAGLFAEFPALHAGTTKQLAVLLLRHALATLLDH
jgi:hypothetical protein